MVCTVDCLTTYGCGIPFAPTPGAVFAPYVILKCGIGNGLTLTVGNNSSPPVNHAVISSFQYGFTPGTPGYGADFEVLDTGGVLYRQIIRALNKTITKVQQEIFGTEFDFGWIIKDCNGNTTLQTAKSITGKTLHGIITHVQQVTENGVVKLKFRIEGPATARVPDTSHDNAEGDQENAISIKDALRRLFTEQHPRFSNVEFRNKDGGELKFKNRDGGEDGPLGTWPMNQQNALSAARAWLNSLTTENDRGILILYDPDSNSIVFQEDVTDNKCCSRTLGTYIVNGGNCSPVLGFNPDIKWQLGTIPGGGATTGGAASGANNAFVEPTKDIQKAGTQSGPTVQEHEWLWRNPDDCPEGASKGFAAHLEANQIYELGFVSGFEASLKLFGDPSYSFPPDLVSRTVAIIVINPFHIDNNCTWVTTTNCSAILSNKNYLVLGVEHQITAGSYITTLKLSLAIPNRDIDATDALGGNGCGTETFTDNIGSSEATNANDADQQ